MRIIVNISTFLILFIFFVLFVVLIILLFHSRHELFENIINMCKRSQRLLRKILGVDHFSFRISQFWANDLSPDPIRERDLREASAESQPRFCEGKMDLRPVT